MTVALVYAAELSNEGWHAAWDALDSKAKDRAVEVLEEVIVEVKGRIFLCADMITMHEDMSHRVVPKEMLRLPDDALRTLLRHTLKGWRRELDVPLTALLDWLLEQAKLTTANFQWRLLAER